MNNIYYCNISVNGSGLCNQLFAYITAVIIAIRSNKRAIIINKFSADYKNNNKIPVSEVFNIFEMDKYGKKVYNINLFDKNVKLNILDVKYGIENINIDLTSEFKNKLVNNKLLSFNDSLNTLKGDPSFGNIKKLYLKYSLNDIEFNEVINENMTNRILFDLDNVNYSYNFGWINDIDRDLFDELLRNIVFQDKFIYQSDTFYKNNNISPEDKINVIHLRLEDDAINYWSKVNKLTEKEFENIIINKYIGIIGNNINKNDNTILLSYSTDNKIIRFLKENNYKYYINTSKLFEGRELNAIVDLIISEKCNNVFIGNFNMEKLNGSTFSYTIHTRLNNKHKKSIMLDLDRILDDDLVIYS